MTTTLEERSSTRAAPSTRRNDGFVIIETAGNPGLNRPQRVARRLWLPMFVMALMGFGAGFVISIVRAGIISDGDPADAYTILALRHVGAAFMFLGFASVFSAITFAVARILGAFRTGGGEVQSLLGVSSVQTLKMPKTAKAMLALMMMGMMAIIVPVVLHLIVAAGIDNDPGDLVDAEQWFVVLEGIRRFGVAIFLMGIALGLASIVTVLRFQAVRIREATGAG